MTINLNELIPGVANFKWKEALWLPSWEIHTFPSDEQAQNIIETAAKLQEIRTLFQRPINIHSFLRPNKYNHEVGGSPYSAHIDGMAADFDVSGNTCDEVRKILEPKLEELNIRMENLPGSGWVHIDRKPPRASGRYFKI